MSTLALQIKNNIATQSSINQAAWSLAKKLANGSKGSKKYFGQALKQCHAALLSHVGNFISKLKLKLNKVLGKEIQKSFNFSFTPCSVPPTYKKVEAIKYFNHTYSPIPEGTNKNHLRALLVKVREMEKHASFARATRRWCDQFEKLIELEPSLLPTQKVQALFPHTQATYERIHLSTPSEWVRICRGFRGPTSMAYTLYADSMEAAEQLVLLTGIFPYLRESSHIY